MELSEEQQIFINDLDFILLLNWAFTRFFINQLQLRSREFKKKI